MQKLNGRVQHYAWGSHTILAELTGRVSPTPEPEAELWLGAHESASADLGDRSLRSVISTDPPLVLGADIAARWGGRLPFLLKILAPAQALSIQCHPDARQAADAAAGTYADTSSKPEAVVALTQFELFGGMAPYADIVARFRSLNVAELREISERCRTAHEVLAAILAVPEQDRVDLVARTLLALAGQHAVPDAEAAAVRSVAQDYPGDIGLIVLLTMHHRVLDPGSYLFVSAGVLHVYLRGAAIEILANSDNVVRAGLTTKKIDVPELLRIVQVERQMVPEVGSSQGRVVRYPVSVPQFSLTRVDPGASPESIDVAGPRIALCVGGAVCVRCDGASIELGPGEATFLTAAQGAVQVSGTGTTYLAAPGGQSPTS